MGRDAEGQIVTMKCHELIPMLLNELQKLIREIERLSAEVAAVNEGKRGQATFLLASVGVRVSVT